MGGVTVLNGDKGYIFHKGSNVEENRCVDPEGDESVCAVAYKENNLYNISMKPKGKQDPEDPGGAHDPMRDDAMDGEELMVPRVPILSPEPSARQIAEHELTAHAVFRSWCRYCVASKGARTLFPRGRRVAEIGIDYGFFGRDREDVLPILCIKCRNSSTGCLGATVVDRKGASDDASSFLTAFIKRLGCTRILVTSDNERSLLSLIERVTNNLTVVEFGADDVSRRSCSKWTRGGRCS